MHDLTDRPDLDPRTLDEGPLVSLAAWRSGGAAVLLIVASIVATPEGSWAGSTEERLADERDRAYELDAWLEDAADELASIRTSIADLEPQVHAAQQRLEDADAAYAEARDAADAAGERAGQAADDLLAAEQELAVQVEMLADLARDTYKYGRGVASSTLATFELVLVADDADGLSDGLHYLERGLGARTAVIEESEALRGSIGQLADIAEQQELTSWRAARAAEAYSNEAAAAHAHVDRLMAETSIRLEQQAQLVATMEQEQAEIAASIAALQEQLEAELEEERRRQLERELELEQAREAERVREAERALEAERDRVQELERQRAQAQPRSTAQRPATPALVPGSSAPADGLVSVRGITVAASLAPQLEALLDAARADGIELGGWGWRSSEVQASLRRTNGCPDVYDSPASSCRVPTARPGTSEHEKGLAVDFTWQGRTICYPLRASACNGNAAFDWLQANAANHGFYVLPSEAWHWSTTGR